MGPFPSSIDFDLLSNLCFFLDKAPTKPSSEQFRAFRIDFHRVFNGVSINVPFWGLVSHHQNKYLFFWLYPQVCRVMWTIRTSIPTYQPLISTVFQCDTGASFQVGPAPLLAAGPRTCGETLVLGHEDCGQMEGAGPNIKDPSWDIYSIYIYIHIIYDG